MEPQIQYVQTSDGINIAYYAMGQGPAQLTLILPPSHLEAEWQVERLRMAYGFGLRMRFLATNLPSPQRSTLRHVLSWGGLRRWYRMGPPWRNRKSNMSVIV